MSTQSSVVLSDIAANARRSDIRDLLHHASKPGVISLAGGLPAEDLFDIDGISHAIKAVMERAPRSALQYGPTEGQPSLKAALSQLMSRRGMSVSADQMLVTTGSQQAIDLLARVLVNPRDIVAVESPTYLAAVNVFDLVKPQYLKVPSTPFGMDVDALVASPVVPKVLYIVPTFSNPRGTTMPMENRLKLLHWAAKKGVFIVEDDPYGELGFPGAQPIPTIHQLAAPFSNLSPWVAYTSTLSKTVAPGMRLGWVTAPPTVLDATVRVKQALDLHTSSFAQEIAAEYLNSGYMDTAVSAMRHEYAKRAKVLQIALLSAFGGRIDVAPTSGGMFIWARFNDGTQTRPLLDEALTRGVIFVPGSAFYSGDTSGQDELRLSFASNSVDRIQEGVQRLLAAHKSLHSNRTSVDTYRELAQ